MKTRNPNDEELWEACRRLSFRNSRTRLPMSTVLVLPATYRIAISSLRHGRKPAVGAALQVRFGDPGILQGRRHRQVRAVHGVAVDPAVDRARGRRAARADLRRGRVDD